jgi:hypothetical protein
VLAQERASQLRPAHEVLEEAIVDRRSQGRHRRLTSPHRFDAQAELHGSDALAPGPIWVCGRLPYRRTHKILFLHNNIYFCVRGIYFPEKRSVP